MVESGVKKSRKSKRQPAWVGVLYCKHVLGGVVTIVLKPSCQNTARTGGNSRAVATCISASISSLGEIWFAKYKPATLKPSVVTNLKDHNIFCRRCKFLCHNAVLILFTWDFVCHKIPSGQYSGYVIWQPDKFVEPHRIVCCIRSRQRN